MQFASDCAMEITKRLDRSAFTLRLSCNGLIWVFAEANILVQQGKQISLPEAWSVSIVLMYMFVTHLGYKHLISAKFLLKLPRLKYL
jgi:hypothetical protein